MKSKRTTTGNHLAAFARLVLIIIAVGCSTPPVTTPSNVGSNGEDSTDDGTNTPASKSKKPTTTKKPTAPSPVPATPPGSEVFTTGSGTWKVPQGISSVTIEIWGGGGGGGSSDDGGGGGGGGGGYAKAVITTSPGTEFNYSVGAGGKAGPTATAGGQTTIGGPATITADGGLPGADGNTKTVIGGVGGAASSGTEGQKMNGMKGDDGTLASNYAPRGGAAIYGGAGAGGDAACSGCATKINPTAGTAGQVKFSW